MQEVKILGISGSPRRGANTAILVKKALEGASSVPDVKTELYELAGKKIHHCIGCMKCLDKGACVFKDDFQDFVTRWMRVAEMTKIVKVGISVLKKELPSVAKRFPLWSSPSTLGNKVQPDPSPLLKPHHQAALRCKEVRPSKVLWDRRV